MFGNCSDIQRKINTAGKTKTPFLFAVDFELWDGFFIENPLQQHDVLFDFNGVGNFIESDEKLFETSLEIQPESFDTYTQRFDCVKKGLHRGDSFLTNLTIKTPIDCTMSLEEIFHRSRAKYRLLLPDKFVCFSPETFVKIEHAKIYTFPMKGTIDANLTDAETTVLKDYKEKSEHNTIVDLLRNDLNRISTGVKVNRFRYIDRLNTHKGDILQVSSEIEGTLPEDWQKNIGTLLLDLLPAGSVSGAPKQATLAIICEAEREARGFYTGVAGYFDGETLDSCVLIRFIEKQDNQLYFRSGGGITVNSNCASEYREAIQKVYLPFQPS